MNTNRFVGVLAILILGTQGLVLYKQYDTSRARADFNTQEPVRDVSMPTVISLTGLPSKGSSDAKVVLLEISDYECPFCGRYTHGVGVQVEKQFIESGKVQLVFLNNPLPMHPNARVLATAAICAENQNRFWEMHDALFNIKPTSKSSILDLASRMDFDLNKFSLCLDDDPEPEQRLIRESKLAKDLGLPGTPSFAIGKVLPGAVRQLQIEKLISGAQPLPIFEKAIEEVLGKKPRA